MPDSVYDEPAPEGYEQVGWTCVYHDFLCHNPTDCMLLPRWRRKRDARLPEHWKRWREMTDDERESVVLRSG